MSHLRNILNFYFVIRRVFVTVLIVIFKYKWLKWLEYILYSQYENYLVWKALH